MSEKMKHKQRNIVIVTHERIHDLLGLDDDHEVVNVYSTSQGQSANSFRVVISGPSCIQVPEGEVMPWVTIKNGKVEH